MNSVQQGRINKTKWYFIERESFLNQLRIEIKRHILRCKKNGFKPAIRLNGTSDIDWNIHGLYNEFPKVKFYDYTKIYKRALKYVKKQYPKNYHLTYSLNEDNKAQALDILKRGGNISAVFKQLAIQPALAIAQVLNPLVRCGAKYRIAVIYLYF